jgi:hypothetical protein
MALTIEELKQQVALLVKQAEAQSRVSNSLEDYLKGLEESKKLSKEINRLREKEEEVFDKIRALRRAGNHAEANEQREILKLLKSETDELEKQNKIFDENLKKVKVTNLLMAKGAASIAKGLANLPNLIQQGYGKIKGLGLFELDKAVKMSALSMGVLSKEGKGFSDNLRKVALYSNDLGVNLDALAKMQADYSEELGRSVVLGEEGLKAMAQLSTVVGLGAEGAAKMSADMDNMGYSAEKTRDFVEKTLNDSHKMGLNASKVVKNISQNMKMLNKYNFKGGVKGLAKMAETTTKLGVSMEFATGMADKLFDIEGAVDMSAQLQVMGGEWSKLADPFKLMYMARNDMEGLTAALGKAAESSVHFNKENGEFEISALEMHRLRKVAEQMGVSYEELAQAGKNAAKFTKIKSQMNFSIGGSEEDKQLAEYLTNKSIMEDGKAKITIGGEKKLLSTLSETDKKILRDQVKEQQNIEKRAKESQTFDEKLTNLINMMKVTLLPIIDGIDSVLGPIARDLMGSDDFKAKMVSLGKNIAGFVKLGAEIVKSVAQFAIWLGPTGTLMAFLGLKGLMSAAGWISNGLLLAQGFNMGTGKGSSLLKMLGGPMGMLAKSVAVLGAGVAGWAAGKWIGGKLSESVGNKSTEEGDTSSMWGAGLGAALALGIGAALAIPTGGLSLVGAAALAGGGALAGGAIGKVGGDAMNQKSTYSPTLNPSVDDAMFEGRGIIQGGKITPLDKKDDILAMKSGGAVDNYVNEKKQVNVVRHEFGDITLNGNITISSPGGEKNMTEFLKDPIFMRNLTTMIHSETEKVVGQGKN